MARFKKQAINKKVWILLGIVIALVLCAVLGVVWVNSEIKGSGSDEMVQVSIEQGSSAKDIAKELKEEGVIPSETLFRLYVKWNKVTGFQYGDHMVNAAMGYKELCETLSHIVQQEETVSVTIPEGYTVPQIADQLEKSGVCSAEEFIQVLQTSSFGLKFEESMSTSEQRIFKYEGYLFPETYSFYKDDDPARVAKLMLEQFDATITDDMYARMEELGLTLDETVVLASIIQKESFTDEDMLMVSSVFHNRLNSSDLQRLESDATITFLRTYDEYGVQYIEEQADAYNTYDVVGLPVGPINCPGEAAITAALYPAQSDYYYFVTDGYNNYLYAKTYDEHLANVAEANKSW